MQGDIVSTVLLPLGLAFIMFTLGVALTPADFKRVFRYPRAFAVGTLCHFVLLPLVGFLVVKLWGVTGALAVGFMIIAACPTGTTSNLLTYHARGDVALALSFTAVASLMSIITVPLIIGWSMDYFLGASRQIAVPVDQIIVPIFVILAIPVGAGMLLRAKAPDFSHRYHQRMSTVATLIFVLIIAAAIAKNWALFKEHTATLAPLVFSINVTMLLLGFGLSKLVGVDIRQAATVAIESSVQNGTLAIVIASSILKDDVMSLPGAVYGVLMYVTGIAFVFLMRKFAPPLSKEEEAAAQAAMH
ncbi:MAG: bile acid:sodium symporter family protein [Betaproteobacteria bacterium]|nr:bile acid:sodium symporter family protein [Betaproteobacteria bacterium]